MKFNWGTGMVIVSLLFMSFIVTLVVKTYGHKVDLVAEDYYDQELHFQERIDKMNNIKNPNDKVVWEVTDKEIILKFPNTADSTISGNIDFFRPSDSSRDKKIKIQLNKEKKQYVNKSILSNGLYKLKIDWKSGNKGYYMEEDIFIQ